MPRNWWLILLLLLGVWQVVGTLIEKAGKKQQEQRLKDLAAQRARQAGARGESTPAPATRPRTATDRAEALAARRREQLEQLRRRAAGRGTTAQAPSGPTPTARPGPAAPPAAGRRPISQPQPGPFQTPSAGRLAPTPVVRRPATPTPTRTPTPRPTRVPTRPAPERAVAPRPEPAEPREAAPVQGEPSTRRVVMDAAEAPEAARKRHLPLPFVPGEPLGPHLLRQMVLFREILEPPVSLRDRQVWERL